MSRPRKVLYLEIDLKRAREKQREAWRRRKKRERDKRTPEQRRAQQAREDSLCIASERIEPHLERGADPDGCWLWRGGYVRTWAGARPLIRAGQYGRVYADVAVWLWATGRKEMPRGARPKRSCGNLQCVAPHHALMTNPIVERAKRRLQTRGDHGDLRKEAPEQGSEGRRRAG